MFRYNEVRRLISRFFFILPFSILVNNNFRASWLLAPVTRNILLAIIHCFVTGAKMESRFETFSKDDL